MPNRQTLLILHEDTHSVREIETIASAWFIVVATRSPQRALTVLRADPAVACLLADQNLGATSGLTVLRAAQTLRPGIRRVLMAAPGQLSDVIEGLHSGVVDRVLYKPITAHDLASALSMPDFRRATA